MATTICLYRTLAHQTINKWQQQAKRIDPLFSRLNSSLCIRVLYDAFEYPKIRSRK